MTITCEVEARQAKEEMLLLRCQADRLGDELATAKLWDADRQTSELGDAAECIQQAIETIGYAIRERDDAIAEYERERWEGPEAADVYSPSNPMAA